MAKCSMLLIALLTLAFSSAASRSEACKSKEFSLTMRVGTGNADVPLNAIYSGYPGQLYLVADEGSSCAGTPGRTLTVRIGVRNANT